MAVAFRSKSQTVGNGTSVTGTEPAGTVQDDVLVAVYMVNASGLTIGIPSGWIPLQGNTSATNEMVSVLCYIVRGASAPSFAFTHTGTWWRELHIFSFSGVDTTYPIDAFTYIPSTNAAANNPNPPSATALSNASMALAIGLTWSGSGGGGYGAPSGYTLRSDNTPGNDVAVATKLLSASGAEDPGAFTGTGAGVGDNWSATLLLAPSGVSPPTASPRQVSEYESYWQDPATPKTVSVTVDATSDVLVLTGMTSDAQTTLNTPTGGSGVSWTLEESDTTAQYSGLYIWTATNISPQTFTLSITSGGTSNDFGISLMRFADAAVGSSAKSRNANGAPSVNLLTTQANSAIVVATNDWNAGGGASRAWLTNAGTVNEQTYASPPAYTTYMGLHENAGAINTYAVGLSTPSNLKYNIVALEIKATIVVSPPLVAWMTA